MESMASAVADCVTLVWRRAKKVREERHAGATAKRRKMSEELEKRERTFQAERNEEQAARSRLKVRTLYILHRAAYVDIQAHISAEDYIIGFP